MLTEPCIEVLLDDEALTDEVWALCDAATITNDLAAWSWWTPSVTDSEERRCQ